MQGENTIDWLSAPSAASDSAVECERDSLIAPELCLCDFVSIHSHCYFTDNFSILNIFTLVPWNLMERCGNPKPKARFFKKNDQTSLKKVCSGVLRNFLPFVNLINTPILASVRVLCTSYGKMHLDSLQQAATGRTNERYRGEKSNFDHVRQESGKQ